MDQRNQSRRSCSRHFRFIPDIGHVVAALSDATGQQRRSRDLMSRFGHVLLGIVIREIQGVFRDLGVCYVPYTRCLE
jgi:hypothetical protein